MQQRSYPPPPPDELPASDHIDPGGILDSRPRNYPSPVHMASASIDKHVRTGRRAEISMSLYGVNMCSCCGSVKPNHEDPLFPKDAPFQRMHLLNKSHHAWHCACMEYCKGSQFYASERSSVMSWYKEKHGGLTPSEYELNNNGKVTEVSLCHKCYSEVKSDNLSGKDIVRHCHFHVPIITHRNHLSSASRSSTRLHIFDPQWVWTSTLCSGSPRRRQRP